MGPGISNKLPSNTDAQLSRARVWEVVLWELLDGLQELHRPPELYANCVFGAFIQIEAHTIKRHCSKRVVRTY